MGFAYRFGVCFFGEYEWGQEGRGQSTTGHRVLWRLEGVSLVINVVYGVFQYIARVVKIYGLQTRLCSVGDKFCGVRYSSVGSVTNLLPYRTYSYLIIAIVDLNGWLQQ